MRLLTDIEAKQTLIDISHGELTESVVDELLFFYEYHGRDNGRVLVILQNAIAGLLPVVGRVFTFERGEVVGLVREELAGWKKATR
ncbi:hypothetical protein [Vibrio sp. WXL210]|uniref:hypothetical protein n=1 Tax=Vibrio sp. WXL210 TaxID=3450709 RepID=UPI003EC70CDD